MSMPDSLHAVTLPQPQKPLSSEVTSNIELSAGGRPTWELGIDEQAGHPE